MKRTVNMVLLLTWILSGTMAHANAKQIDSEKNQPRTGAKALSEGRYLEAWQLLEPPDSIPAAFAESYMDQMNGTYLSFLGRHQEAYSHFYARSLKRLSEKPKDELQVEADIDDLTPVDAIAAIREAAKGRRVVILNEAHHDGRHRAFATRLLQGLAADGFTHFAAETFDNSDAFESYATADYPKLGMGYYSMEPYFGSLIRAAMAQDMTLVHHEQTSKQNCSGECSQEERIRARERAQAKNLAAALEQHPEGRFFVYVGYSHLDETGDKDGDGVPEGWMAAELTARTGIDPLTIDQEAGTGYGEPRLRPLVSALNEQYDLKRVSALRHEDGRWFNESKRSVDMTVIHPPLRIADTGRPAWTAMQGERYPHRVAAEQLPKARPILVQALVAEEGEGSIPVDQYLLREGESGDVTLMLPNGEYRLTIQRESSEHDTSLGAVTIAESQGK